MTNIVEEFIHDTEDPNNQDFSRSVFYCTDKAFHLWEGHDDWDIAIWYDRKYKTWHIKETIWMKSHITGKGNYFSRDVWEETL